MLLNPLAIRPLALLGLIAVAGFYCSRADALTLADVTGTSIEVRLIRDGQGVATAAGVVDDVGHVDMMVDDVAVYLDAIAQGDAVDWTIEAWPDGASTPVVFDRVWNGRGWFADVALPEGAILRIGVVGSDAPGEHSRNQAALVHLLSMTLGVVCYQVFIRSWRHRSVML